MVPTLENIAEVAKARMKAIRERAGDFAMQYDSEQASDERLLSATIDRACRLASKAGTAQAAVQWAITDMTPYDALEPAHGDGDAA